MLKVENIQTFGFEGALRGMRNPMNSWELSTPETDLALMKKLFKAGSEHRKYLRMIHIQMDITAPLYWWKEFDTYKVGTVSNSCSTMHKIHSKEFTLSDFSCEHLSCGSIALLDLTILMLNERRKAYITSHNKEDWWQMIQLLPSSYNQRRTIDMNYETLFSIIEQRENHKLDEWIYLIDTLKKLPYVKELLNEQ